MPRNRVGDGHGQTLCHNTLLVDGHSQPHPARPLDLVEYQSLPSVKRLSTGDQAGQLYPGVGQLRSCLVRDQYVLDFFQVSSAAPHDFDWLLHVDGRTEKRSAPRPSEPISFTGQVPWTYPRPPERLDRSSVYWETFEHSGRRLRVDVVCSSPQEILGWGFPRDDRPVLQTIPMRIFRAKQARAWYAALYRSGKNVEQPVELKVTPGELSQGQITVELGNRRYVHRVPRILGMTDPGTPRALTPPVLRVRPLEVKAAYRPVPALGAACRFRLKPGHVMHQDQGSGMLLSADLGPDCGGQ